MSISFIWRLAVCFVAVNTITALISGYIGDRSASFFFGFIGGIISFILAAVWSELSEKY